MNDNAGISDDDVSIDELREAVEYLEAATGSRARGALREEARGIREQMAGNVVRPIWRLT